MHYNSDQETEDLFFDKEVLNPLRMCVPIELVPDTPESYTPIPHQVGGVLLPDGRPG